LRGHDVGVGKVAFTADGKTLITGGLDNVIKFWDVATGKEKQTLTGHAASVLTVSVTRDGKTLASGARNGVVRLWDLTTGAVRHEINAHPGSMCEGTAFSPDDNLLATTGSDSLVK